MWNIWGRIFPWIVGMSVLCASCGFPGSLLWCVHYISANHRIFWVGRVPQRSSLANTCYRLVDPLSGITWRKSCPLWQGFWVAASDFSISIPSHTSLFAGRYFVEAPLPLPSSPCIPLPHSKWSRWTSKHIRKQPVYWAGTMTAYFIRFWGKALIFEHMWKICCILLGTDGSVPAEVENKTTKTYSTIIPCTSKSGFIRTQIFLLSLNVRGFLSAAHGM